MFWLTSKSNAEKEKDSDEENEDSDRTNDIVLQDNSDSNTNKKDRAMSESEEETLTKKIQQVKYELERCKQSGREADGRRREEHKRLQSTLDAKRQKLAKALHTAKSSTSYFEYCRIIRESFDAGRDNHQLRSKPIHHSWYGWCEGFLLRGIHHAMMTKEQLDIVQRNCNALLMDVYADCIPQQKHEKEVLEKGFTAAIIHREQYLARCVHFQRHCLDLRHQMLQRYNYDGQRLLANPKIGPPASSPHTPQSGNPHKGILKNTMGKSTSRWEEDTSNHSGLSPPTRRQVSESSLTDGDDDSEGSFQLEKESPIMPRASSIPISSPNGFIVQPVRVYAVP